MDRILSEGPSRCRSFHPPVSPAAPPALSVRLDPASCILCISLSVRLDHARYVPFYFSTDLQDIISAVNVFQTVKKPLLDQVTVLYIGYIWS